MQPEITRSPGLFQDTFRYFLSRIGLLTCNSFYQLAIRNNEELNKLLTGVTIAQGRVLPSIQAVLLAKKNQGGAGKASSQSQEF